MNNNRLSNENKYDSEIIENQTIVVKENNVRIVVMIIILILALLLASFGAAFSYINYSSISNLNKDIDNDGIPDINIDTDGDNKPNINIDTNNDNKPDLNIDYKGNLKAVFNIDKDNDGIADLNLINQDTNGDGKCDLNCDIDGDGWPDINIDLDGDGKADVDIDTDNDGIADLNLDLDGDGKCDLSCDTDGDLICDYNCIKECTSGKNGNQSCEIIVEKEVEVEKEVIKTIIIEKIVESGSSTESGNSSVYVKGAKLLVKFEDTNEVIANNVVPTDQPDPDLQENINIPDKTFTIQNNGEVPARYNLKWIISKNEFVSNNLKFKVSSTNGGGVLNSYTSLPLNDQVFLSNILIEPGNTQTYNVSFILEGTGGPQNYDQNKIFSGRINAELVD